MRVTDWDSFSVLLVILTEDTHASPVLPPTKKAPDHHRRLTHALFPTSRAVCYGTSALTIAHGPLTPLAVSQWAR